MSDPQFIQARHYHPGRRSPIELLVVHDMEAARSLVTALHVAQWFGGPAAPMASAHYCIDSGSVVQCVKDEDTAWAAPGANDNGLHFELAGYARDSSDVWLADAGELQLAAGLIASKAAQYGIPMVYLDASQLVPGAKGITTHAQITIAMKTIGGHTDPGAGFPMDRFIPRIRESWQPWFRGSTRPVQAQTAQTARRARGHPCR